MRLIRLQAILNYFNRYAGTVQTAKGCKDFEFTTVDSDDNTARSVAQLTPNDAVMIDIALTEEKAKRGIA